MENSTDIQLGSSPLGLVMYTRDNTKVKIGSYVLSGTSSLYRGLFSRDPEKGHDYEFDFQVENTSTYELSTQSIIDYSKGHKMMELKAADFAYLKNLGVYPNNRLVIARRFPSPVADDLINHDTDRTDESAPMSTLVSWVPDGEDFFSVDFNEEWGEAPTSFADILNEASTNTDIMGGDNQGKGIGSLLAQGINVIPLRGWSEGLQYAIFRKLGVTELGPNDLPTGNPNLVRSAKAREVAGKTGRFEGVKATITVKMVVEYEQKFIQNLDPTTVYYDIIANALNFGTSNSKFMFNKEALSSSEFAKFLDRLGSGAPQVVWQALQTFVGALKDALKEVITAVTEKLTSIFDTQSADRQKATEDRKNGVETTVDGKDQAGSLITGSILGVLQSIVAGVVSKYKVKLIGVLNSLTGAPSTPWHVTIGNPRRPVFSSGDMYVESVKVTLGKLLAFNDLPSSIKIEFDLKNARGLGKQEIFRKLNCGRGRSYKQVRLDINSVDFKVNSDLTELVSPTGDNNTNSNNSNNNGPQLTNTSGGKQPTGGTAVGVETPKKQDKDLEKEKSQSKVCYDNFDKIVASMAAEVRAGSGGIFRDGKGFFNDNEDKMAGIFMREFKTGKYAAQYRLATACPETKKLLDGYISTIADGIKSGRGFTKIKLYGAGSVTVSHDP